MVACSGHFHCQLWVYVHIDESMPNLNLFHTLRIIVFFFGQPKIHKLFHKDINCSLLFVFPKNIWFRQKLGTMQIDQLGLLGVQVIFTWSELGQASNDWGCHSCRSQWHISSFICRGALLFPCISLTEKMKNIISVYFIL
jgi:hypothetical protein